MTTSETRQAILDRIKARAAGTIDQAIEDRLAAWITADLATGSPKWTDEDKDPARAWLKEHPDENPTVIDLVKFKSVHELYGRYERVLDALAKQGKVSLEESEVSKKRIRNYSIAATIEEGILLKQWADSH